MSIYVVTMQRYGESELHSYLIGVYTDLAIAAIEGLSHQLSRANKYEPKIDLCKVDSDELIHDIPREVFVNYAKMKYPEKFDDRGELKDD